jgi:putative ABC transport system substrate-binding protein
MTLARCKQWVKARVARCLSLGGWFCLTLLAFPLVADDAVGEIAVFYPDVPDPYVRVFIDIIDGMRAAYPGKIRDKVLDNNASSGDVESWLRQNGLTSVVALGNQAMTLVNQLPRDFSTVTGAVLAAPTTVADDFTAITMAPDPGELFKELRELAPDIRTVHVIYEEELHGRLLERARQAARQQGLTVVSYRFESVAESANLYRKLLTTLDSGRESVWLLQGDSALRERAVLSEVLREAWNSRLLVFSSNPSYVSKGVLFSLYPDNARLGQAIAQTMVAKSRGSNGGIEQTRDLLIAVNVRTAEHLGLNISRSQRRSFDVVFPRK